MPALLRAWGAVPAAHPLRCRLIESTPCPPRRHVNMVLTNSTLVCDDRTPLLRGEPPRPSDTARF